MSELDLSESDSDSSAASILGVFLDGFDGEARMSDAAGAHDDIPVGEAVGVNDSSDIPWCTTVWSAGGVDVGPVKAAKRADEGRKHPAKTLSGKTVTFDPQGAEISENGDGHGASGGRVAGERGGAAEGGGTLEQAENKTQKRLQRNKARNVSQKASPSHKGSHV